MLRISHIDQRALRVEGRIHGEASDALLRACQEARRPVTPLRLHLDGVTSVDLRGIRTLRALRAAGFELVGASNLITAMLAE